MKIKLLGLALATGLLTACGGGGSDSSASSSKNATLADMVGVWDATEVVSGKKDVAYFVVRSDGTRIYYDYKGDAYDNKGNCYETSIGKLEDLGDGKIKDGKDIAKVAVSGNSMNIEEKSGSVVTKTTLYKISKKESEFKPICTA